MHRHCLRSTLLQCTESGSSLSLQQSQHHSFSTSSLVSASSASSRNKHRRTDDKFRQKKHGPPLDVVTKFKLRNPKNVYQNKASEDVGLTRFERVDPNVPTPMRFISPKPFFESLLEQEKQSFVAGQTPEQPQEGDIQLEEELALSASFAPGSFVELRKNERSFEAIVLAERLMDSKMNTLCMISTGEIMTVLPTNIYFCVPNIVSADLVARCGVELIPETPQARNARVEALKSLRVVSIQAQQAAQGSRMWDRQKMLNVYEEIKHHDPTQWATVTLEHVTALFYVQPGYINYYATHKYLMERPLKYVADTGYIRSQTFRVRPERDVKEIETVEDWITQYRFNKLAKNPYKSFIKKARKVVKEYRANPPREIGTMGQEKWDYAWSQDDITILSFLLRSLQQHTSSQLDPYRVGRNAIVKDVLKVGEVTDDIIHRLMIELRVIAPWQDLHALSPLLNPKGDFGVRDPLEKEGDRLFRASSYPKPIAGAILGPLDLIPSDPLDSVRHDFGNLRVFVIDDPTAAELDDGVSLECIPTEPDNHWVHIHIADPARHLHPGHALSHMARKQFTSLYLGAQNFPMLPTSFMHDPKFGLSLTDTSVTDQPNYVLTFSTKVDGQGNVLDYKLRAGVLRNVRKTTYSDVDAALKETPVQKHYPFGGSPPALVQHGAPLSDAEIADLRILKKLAVDQVNKRRGKGIISPNSVSARVEMQTLPPAEIQSPNLSGSVFYGFPEMQYFVSSLGSEDAGARSLVSEMMKLACRTASRVALDHNVPFIRRALQPFVWGSDANFEAALKLTDDAGLIPHQDFVRLGAFATSGHYTLQPEAHAVLGLPAGEGYTRATSPLRRYMDLVMHWQLHHILLGPKSPSRPPFSAEDLEKLIIDAGVKDVQYRRLEKANIKFYAHMYLKRFANETTRGVERPFGDPLARMKAWTLKTPARDHTNSLAVPVMLPEIGIQALLNDVPPHFGDLPPGSDLFVKMQSIDLGLRRTKMYVTLI